MNDPTFSRIAAQSGSSLGSNTTHCRAPIQALFEEQRGAPHGHILPLVGQRVRAHECARSPQQRPIQREGAEAVQSQRIQTTPFSVSLRLYVMLCTPFSVASIPPEPSIRRASHRSSHTRPATTPEGANVRSCPLFSASASRSRGQKAAPFASTTPMPLDFQSTAQTQLSHSAADRSAASPVADRTAQLRPYKSPLR